MNENMKALLEKVMADQELQAKFSQIKDEEEAYALASSIQSGFTKEEFIAEMTKVKESMEEDLTDEDLAKSAGGDADTVVATVTISVGTVVSAVSWGAAAAV
ncbi:MAG: Nif11-like leader peptide family RiPP precursor [Oscillospiraceae bacterium]|nr:Nif11-like leader peptide family RiPP precursor [Oscillospiraceae bacterium]